MLRGGVGATGGAAGAGRRAPPRGPGRGPVHPSSRVGGFPARVRRGAPATSPSGRRAELCVSRCPQGRWGCVARRLGCEGEMLGHRGRPVVGRLPARPAGARGKAVGCPAGASGVALGPSGRRAELSFPHCLQGGGIGRARRGVSACEGAAAPSPTGRGTEPCVPGAREGVGGARQGASAVRSVRRLVGTCEHTWDCRYGAGPRRAAVQRLPASVNCGIVGTGLCPSWAAEQRLPASVHCGIVGTGLAPPGLPGNGSLRR